jgi:transcriptional regulator with XRE-family HTH domain
MATILPFVSMGQMPNRLRELRKAHKWTLEYVALEIGTAPGQVAQLERGMRPLTPGWMARFAALFHVKPGALLNPEDNPTILSDEEAAFLDRYRAASSEQRRTLGGLMDVVIPYRSEQLEEDSQSQAA